MRDLEKMSDNEFSDWLASRSELMTHGLTVDQISSFTDEQLDDEIWNFLSDNNAETLGDLSAVARAFFATKAFEGEVGNGGLHQFFFNHADPAMHEAVAAGYETLGLTDQARQFREVILPAAAAERRWRESLPRDATFFDSYKKSRLPKLDKSVGDHVQARCEFVRANPSAFTTAAE